MWFILFDILNFASAVNPVPFNDLFEIKVTITLFLPTIILLVISWICLYTVFSSIVSPVLGSTKIYL